MHFPQKINVVGIEEMLHKLMFDSFGWMFTVSTGLHFVVYLLHTRRAGMPTYMVAFGDFHIFFFLVRAQDAVSLLAKHIVMYRYVNIGYM